jgi:DNA-binding LytR/AlgR family response regulator
MNCIVIKTHLAKDDVISSYIEETSSLNLLGNYSNFSLASKKIKNLKIDIIFLDIDSLKENGFAFIKKYELIQKTQLILLTTNTNHIIDAYQSGVIDCVLKPVSYERFLKSIVKVIDQKSKDSYKNNFMFIKTKGQYIKLLFQHIVWVKSNYEYVEIYTLDKKYMVYSSMNNILEKLPNSFIRVHRSNIVSLDRIDKIEGNVLEVEGQLIKIGDMYKNELLLKLGILNSKS